MSSSIAVPFTSGSGGIESILASGVIDAVVLKPYYDTAPGEHTPIQAIKREAAWSQLLRLDGRHIASLAQNESTLVSRALQTLLNLSEAPEIAVPPGSLNATNDQDGNALARLDNLRLGQPDPALMLSLSSRIGEALDYLAKRFMERRPVVRLVVGEMGEGKSTLARSIRETAIRERATPILLTMPRTKTFDPAGWFRDMALHQELISMAIREIAETALVVDDGRRDALLSCFRTAPLSLVMRGVIDQAIYSPSYFVTMEGARHLGRECEEALTPWLSTSHSRVMPAKNFLKRNKVPGVFTGAFNNRLVPTLMEEFLYFYAEAGIYPVWLFDEFESIAALNGDRRGDALGFFRDGIDAVSATSHGALFLFSTGDGLASIRSYPALEDRLKCTDDWALSSPTWHARDLACWEAKTVMRELLALYDAAATDGDTTAKAVVEHQGLLSALLEKQVAQAWLNDPSIVPRERLKSLIGLLDIAHDGEEALKAQIEQLLAGEEPQAPSDYEDWCEQMEADEDDPLLDAMKALGMLPCPLSDKHDDGEASNESLDLDEDDELEVMSSESREATSPMGMPRSEHSNDEVSRFSSHGLQRWEIRKALAGAKLPFQLTDSQHPAKSMEVHCERIRQASGHAYLGYRLAKFRDAGGDIKTLWESLPGNALSLGRHDRVVLAPHDSDTDEHLQAIASDFLAMVDHHDGLIPVAMPESRDQRKARKHLEQQDREAIREMHDAGLDPWPFMRDKIKWPGCREPGVIRPLENVQIFRQALYTWFSLRGVVPRDEWIDQFVLTTLKERFGYSPRTSREGVQFILKRGGLLARFEKSRSISTEAMPVTLEEELGW